MSDRLFTMLQVNDVHVTLGEDPRNTRGKLAALASMAQRGQLTPAPDLVLLAGDLVDLPREDALQSFLDLAGPLAALPRLSIPGNHDVMPPDAPSPDDPFFRLMPATPAGCEVIRFRGVRFILLNDADGDRQPTPFTAARNHHLAGELERRPAEPTIIAAHVPLVPLREERPLAASFDFPTWKNLDPQSELLNIIERHAGTVIAVLGGHLHLTARVQRAGIHHIVPCGLMSWPYDAALYDFFPDKIEVRMASLPEGIDPGSLGRYPLRNGVHDRHGSEFTDSGHPTMADYIRGRPDERAFTITLRGSKMIQ